MMTVKDIRIKFKEESGESYNSKNDNYWFWLEGQVLSLNHQAKLKDHGVIGSVMETAKTMDYVEIVRGSSYMAKDGSLKPALVMVENGIEKLVAPKIDLYSL